MKCVNCGAEIKEGNVFCTECGKETQIVPDYNVFEDEYLKKLLEEQTNKEVEEFKEENQKKENTSTKDNHSAIVAVSVSLVLVLVVIAGALFAINKNRNANSISYQISHGASAFASGDYDTAIEYYNNALKLDPNSTETRLALATIYEKTNDFDSAYMELHDAIEADSDSVEAYKAMIALLAKQDKIDDIVTLSEQVTDLRVLALFEDYIVTSPTFSKDGGTYEEYFELELKTSSDYEIYYTTDGSDPITRGELYKSVIYLEDLPEADSYTIKAVSKNSLGIFSKVAEVTYKIDLQAPDMAVVTPDGGTIKEETMITIAVPDHCIAFYTWDGTTPSINSTQYVGPIPVEEGDNILSVIIKDENTGLFSNIYRGHFVYYPDAQ